MAFRGEIKSTEDVSKAPASGTSGQHSSKQHRSTSSAVPKTMGHEVLSVEGKSYKRVASGSQVSTKEGPTTKKRKIELSSSRGVSRKEQKIIKDIKEMKAILRDMGKVYGKCREYIKDGALSRAGNAISRLRQEYPQLSVYRNQWPFFSQLETGERELAASFDHMYYILHFIKTYHQNSEDLQKWNRDLPQLVDIHSKDKLILSDGLNLVTYYLLDPYFDTPETIQVRLYQARRHLLWIKNTRSLRDDQQGVWLKNYWNLCSKEIANESKALNGEERKIFLETEQLLEKINDSSISADDVSELLEQRRKWVISMNCHSWACISLGKCARAVYEKYTSGSKIIKEDKNKSLLKSERCYFPSMMLALGTRAYHYDNLKSVLPKFKDWDIKVGQYGAVYDQFIEDQVLLYMSDWQKQDIRGSIVEHCGFVYSVDYLLAIMEKDPKQARMCYRKLNDAEYISKEESNALNLAIAWSYYLEGKYTDAKSCLWKIKDPCCAVNKEKERIRCLLLEKEKSAIKPLSIEEAPKARELSLEETSIATTTGERVETSTTDQSTQTDLAGIKITLVSSEDQQAQIEDEISKVHRDHHDELKHEKERYVHLKNEFFKKRKKVESKEKELAKVKKECDELQAKGVSSSVEIVTLKREIQEQSNSIEKINKQKEELETKFKHMKVIVSDLRSASVLDHYKAENLRLNLRVQNQGKLIEANKKHHLSVRADMVNEINDLNKKLSESLGKNKKLEEKYNDLLFVYDRDIASANESITVLKRNIEELQTELTNKDS